MGYYTRYELHYDDEGIDKRDREVFHALHQVNSSYFSHNDFESSQYYSNTINHTYFYDEIKWYTYKEDMRAVSLLVPNVLFELSGNGEDDDDIWKAYFKNGKMQYCPARIEFDEFDESKLK